MRDRCYAAFLFDEKGEYDAAIAEFTVHLTKSPRDYVALNNRGVMHWEVGQIEEAQKDLESACALATDDPLPHENLGRVLKERGERDRAIASYRRALAISPHRTTARACLAELTSSD